ncbi:MtrAB system histidine kinase MtrB [Psychromicrobium lacuslunae]|uniref:MtrAB system histidine kinase MtrB n=1 Tax=Psychromicrobium lacuslunae TaxID=1618207 RepID=UPI0005D3D152|nr:MtrAB system histidine kinase MtrB [Psychromicrobium lacuslunae]
MAGLLSRLKALISKGWAALSTLLKREYGWAIGRWRRSMQFRTVLVTLLVTFLTVGGVGIFLSNQIANGLFQERLEQATAEAKRSVARVQNKFDGTNSLQVTDKAGLVGLAQGVLKDLSGDTPDTNRGYLLVLVPGQNSQLALATSITSAENGSITPAILPDDLRSSVRGSSKSELFWKSIALPVDDKGSHPALAMGGKVDLVGTSYELYLVFDLNKTQDTLNYIQSVLWISGAAILLLIGGITWYVTRNVVQPVSQAALVAEKLAAGELQERMNARGEDEVARLADSFNKMATALQDQINQLASLSQMQRNFVSDVSHELRTPLTTVRMAAEVLYESRDSFDPVNRRSAELMYHQVERFQDLLADLLEISRFDAGAAVLDWESQDLFSVIDRVIDAAQPLADQIGSTMTVVSAVEGDHCVLEMDSRRIERILRNLIVNALEHGEKKPVEIFVAADAEVVGIAVRDHGIGMDQEVLSRVFDRFWRADPARARTTGGSGLGLAIATEDSHLHHGKLEVWARPGEGSCFRLTLPRRRNIVVDHSPVNLPPEEDPTQLAPELLEFDESLKAVGSSDEK